MNSILSDNDARIVMEILTRELGVSSEQLTPDVSFEEDFGSDSLTLIEIMMAIEERFDLAIPEARWEKVKTVGDLFETLGELLEARRR